MSDFDRTAEFMVTHSRLLDRRRFELLFGGGTAEAGYGENRNRIRR